MHVAGSCWTCFLEGLGGISASVSCFLHSSQEMQNNGLLPSLMQALFDVSAYAVQGIRPFWTEPDPLHAWSALLVVIGRSRLPFGPKCPQQGMIDILSAASRKCDISSFMIRHLSKY